MARSVGPDPDERSPPPDPDRQFESRRMKRAQRRRESSWSCGWGIGAALRELPAGVFPVIATRDGINLYRARHYGWKGQAVTAWNKLAHQEKFATTPSRWDFLKDFPGTAGRAVFYGLIWNLLGLLFITRYGTWRAWVMVTRGIDLVERLVCWAIGCVLSFRGPARRGWDATVGRVIGDD